MMPAALSARTSSAFAVAAITQPAAKRRRAFTKSGRFSTADTSVPATKPPCTAIVSHAVVEPAR